MSQGRSVVPVNTFVLRFWRESSGVGPCWRGRIEHVQSGESAAFSELDGMLVFLGRFGIDAGDTSRGSACGASQEM